MSAELSKVRVLLADGNAHMRTLVSSVLTAIGVGHVTECADSTEALDALNKTAVDIAIIEHRLSPIDGLELARRVRDAGASAHAYLPIIMLTGSVSRDLVLQARDAGINEFVAKPMTAQALLNRLNAVIFRPRAFVKTADYFGPDRRRKQDELYEGPWRRAEDADRPVVRTPPGAKALGRETDA